MNDLTTPALPTDQLVEQGADLYAKLELALHDAEEAALGLRKIYYQAYANSDLKGGEAITARASMVTLAGAIASIHEHVIELHQRDIGYAQAAGKDVATPYAELPPLSGIHTDGGGR